MRIGVILDALSAAEFNVVARQQGRHRGIGPRTPASGITLVQIYKAVESESAVTDTDMFNLKE